VSAAAAPAVLMKFRRVKEEDGNEADGRLLINVSGEARWRTWSNRQSVQLGNPKTYRIMAQWKSSM
jgi:hypothetical protein